jgi:hypothetical protein
VESQASPLEDALSQRIAKRRLTRITADIVLLDMRLAELVAAQPDLARRFRLLCSMTASAPRSSIPCWPCSPNSARSAASRSPRWSEIDPEAEIWTLPGARTKNGKPHIVHLSVLALEIIGAVPHIEGQDLLFSRTGATPASGFSRAKRRLDALLSADGDGTRIAPWTLHDLRRSATTGMARLGIAPHVVDRVLNHQAGTIRGVAAVYNRFEYLAERQAALEAWGRFVQNLAQPSRANVVSLRPAG